MIDTSRVLLVVCGVVLILCQYIAVREIGAIFFSTEIITLLSVIMIMLGPSIAYGLCDRVSEKLLKLWSLGTFLVLISLPFGLRFLVSIMKSYKLELAAMVLVLLVGSLFCSAFFAVFLPKLSKSNEDFKTLYGLELIGSILAMLLIAVIGNWTLTIYLFWVFIVVSVSLAFKNKAISSFYGVIAIAAMVFYPGLNNAATEKFYEVYWDKENPEILETIYSPYQRIDVVKDDKGKSLFLDGVPYYEAGDLHWFNYYIAELPGSLLKEKKDALIVGSGTLSSTGYLVRQGFDVTTVDIDSKVAKMGRKYFSDLNKLKDDQFKLVIADARRFIKTVPDNSKDLIVLDIPAPYHIQTALLYVPSFFQELSRCLKPGGIVALNTCSYRLQDEISSSIAKSACSVFDDVYAIQGETLGLTILYCSDNLPFNSKSLGDKLAEEEKRVFRIFNNKATRYIVSDAKAHTEDNLCALIMLSRYEIPEND